MAGMLPSLTHGGIISSRQMALRQPGVAARIGVCASQAAASLICQKSQAGIRNGVTTHLAITRQEQRQCLTHTTSSPSVSF